MIFSSKEEYKKVFEEYYNPLCNFASKYVSGADIAEDIVQEVFVQIWQKREKITITSGIRSYLFQSTRNKAIEVIRRNKLQSAYINQEKYNLETSYEIDKEAENFMLKEQLNKSIRQLPPKCQKIFMLSKMNGLTYGEIAEELNLSVKTVENQIGRGLKLLRAMLTKMRSDNEDK